MDHLSAPTEINLKGSAAWNEFWATNGGDLTENPAEKAEEMDCMARAFHGRLMIGGGAAPLFSISFEW